MFTPEGVLIGFVIDRVCYWLVGCVIDRVCYWLVGCVIDRVCYPPLLVAPTPLFH